MSLTDISSIFFSIRDNCCLYFNNFRTSVNEACTDYDAFTIIAFLTVFYFIFYRFYRSWFDQPFTLKQLIVARFFRFVKSLPFVKARIDKELSVHLHSIKESSYKRIIPGPPLLEELPLYSESLDAILEKLHNYQRALPNNAWRSGKCSGAVYAGGQPLTELNTKIFKDFAWTNPLHLDVFPDIIRIEAEVVQMVARLFNGPPKTCGVFTVGGTESILMACLAYRNKALEAGIRTPEMIIPVTAHAAFDKASMYFRFKLIKVDVDPVTYRANIDQIRGAITSSTCAIVGSAPNFPQGVIDDIEALSDLAIKHNIGLHVDSCLGGMLLAFMEEAGFHELPPFDFRLPGVTSISCDTHKYGYTPKGSSLLLWRNWEYRRYHITTVTDWPGGNYGSPSMPGSRAGVNAAQTWGTLLYFGRQGYVEACRKVITTTRRLASEIESRFGSVLFILGGHECRVNVICLGSIDFDIYRLFGSLAEKGWHMNATQFPPSFHICLTLLWTQDGVIESFLDDMSACVEEIMRNPSKINSGAAAMYGTAQTIPDRSLIGDLTKTYFEYSYDIPGAAVVQRSMKMNGVHPK